MKLTVSSCLVAAACTAAACSSNDTATEADYDDVAQSLSAVVATGTTGGDVGAMADAANVSLSANDLAIQLSANGKYEGNHLGLEFSYVATCKDAAGAAAQCGASTDSSNVNIAWGGSLALPLVSASVERQGDWTLTKLQTDTATLDGSSLFTLDAQLQPLFLSRNTRTYHVDYEASYAGIQLDREARRVVGGTVTYEINA
ncbi:MAG: hypothetical protein ABW321_03070, partial [Polyangiales bacterium]